MLQNLNNVNLQMQQLADNAVNAAKDKFGINLDFSENSLQQLEILLQQAHERYKQGSMTGKISIENTVRIWGSYLGEVIRRSLGGNWIEDQKDVYLQVDSQKLDPMGQVRSRIMIGNQSNIKEHYEKSSVIRKQYNAQPESKSLAQETIIGNEALIQTVKSSGYKCPICGREYQGSNVTYCLYCGNGVVDGSPNINSSNRMEKQRIAMEIASTEIKIGNIKTRIQGVDISISKLSKGSGNAGLMVFIGAILTPIGIGVILLIVGLIGMISNPIEIGKKKKERIELVGYLEQLQKKYIYLKGNYAIT